MRAIRHLLGGVKLKCMEHIKIMFLVVVVVAVGASLNRFESTDKLIGC